MESLSKMEWWKKAVFYQIYPRSFTDGNGDGIGDFEGMISKLDYLQDLGIDAVWLSPHYPSPNFDCGYDIADYTDVAPEYGSLDKFQQFLDSAHQRGIRVILDMVLNHTSDQHPWFLESRSNRNNPKRDWYIWRNGLNGAAPNNWNSPFGGSAWEWDEQTGQYYYHFFFKEQPDLNWRNPQVKEAMFDAVRFWLDRGVDGFRLDAIGTIFEHPDLPDHPVPMSGEELRYQLDQAPTDERRAELMQLWVAMEQYQTEQPGMHVLMRELRSVIDEYDNRMVVGEDEGLVYHGNGSDELHMVFNFPLMKTDHLTPTWVLRNQQLRLKVLRKISPDAWPCNTLGNHDSSRVWSRYGDGVHDAELARISCALMLTLRGTPFLYNGEEIGMTDLLLKDVGQFKDLLGLWYYSAQVELMGLSPDQALLRAARLTRDKNRTPVQWANRANAGFCPAEIVPWLPINPNYRDGINVEEQAIDPNSLLNFYRKMLKFRRETPALIGGTYHPYHPRNHNILAFFRKIPEQTCLVVLNFSAKSVGLMLPRVDCKIIPLFSTHHRNGEFMPGEKIFVKPYEIVVFELR